ncbi:MAG: hydantoinase B/oxoprolinase family protein [Myxococcota bacterium]|nr:hydantoinase B/oxoprolinase family protein [Myxococcota bacterium]
MPTGPRIFVDRGGTFTDVVTLHPDGQAELRKVPSDRAIVGQLAAGNPLVFGTTVATNALLERTGVPTLLLVTRGLGDLVRIGDMARPELFDPDAEWPAPLCTQVLEVDERLDAQGRVLSPLVLPDLSGVEEGIQAVAIVLAHAPKNPAHELALEAALRKRGLHVSLGHRVDPELGLLARIETTLIDAAITPVLHAAMARDQIPAGAQAMRSDGSLCPAPQLHAPEAVLSGPAGGVLAVAAVAQQAGFERAVGLDMGGTSTDLCRVEAGALPHREGEVRVAGLRLRRPMLEVETIAAGGGSILRSDGHRLSVGPDSAGAHPGPACYGRGGPPTLTDAALLAGLVDPEAFDPPLDASRIALPGDPNDFLELARELMAQAARRLAAARGVDLRDHALVAYGGAAGQHAAGVAERLGIDTVLVHPCASVLSAYGQCLARRQERALVSLWQPLEEVDLEAQWVQLSASLPDLGALERSVSLRVQGSDHHLELSAGPELDARFRSEHQRRYGHLPEGPLEVVNVSVRALGPKPPMPRVQADPFGLGSARVQGPTVLRCSSTSLWVPSGWEAHNTNGLLRLDRISRAPRSTSTENTPYGAALWGARFMAVAEQAGEVLRRTARSVNIRERLDFSCAVFDEAGRLVANAPHIPVHLGAMGETVRDVLQHADLDAAQAWLSNDPQAGGSHLPDLTVVSAVEHQGRRFWVASRGHHADVGGLTPGSMPPHSTRLADEGLVFRRVPLLSRDGRFLPPELPGCRQPQTVLADLRAQVASNHHAAKGLRELGEADLLRTWMAHLFDLADQSSRALHRRLRAGSASEVIRGIPVHVSISTDPAQGLIVDFAGTEGPHSGNLNAPPAVVRAALLYVLRCLAGTALPLNEGALRHVQLRLPSPSLLSPPPGAAVVGGNVETSQRVVDLLLSALQARSPSLGTMNNLSMGGPGWSLYETIGGGVGASPKGPGRSGRQTHMTNTRITDVEVLETRLPLRVHRFGLRPGSGGAGRHSGGQGLLRELELLEGGTAALLGIADPPRAGLEGGQAATPRCLELHHQGAWVPWDGQATELAPCDRVRVQTAGGAGWGSLSRIQQDRP